MADWEIRDLDLRMADISGTLAIHGEPANLLHYTSGQEYKGHYDSFTDDELQKESTVQQGGQRKSTVLGYLNSVTTGGSTSFPRLGVKLQPSLGTVIAFDNIDSDGSIARYSYHSGDPVYNNEDKWTLTKWVRENATHYGKSTHGKK